MSWLKKSALVLATLFVLIQFVRPSRNNSTVIPVKDISSMYVVPDTVQLILQNACYDCHSNKSRYPWYSGIQPIAWMMARHINNGKAALNFNEFGSYTNRRQLSKLTAIANQVRDDEMPLPSYKAMHKNANLTTVEKNLIISWVGHITDSLAAN